MTKKKEPSFMAMLRKKAFSKSERIKAYAEKVRAGKVEERSFQETLTILYAAVRMLVALFELCIEFVASILLRVNTHRSLIKRPPGSTIMAILFKILPRKFCEKIIVETVDDLQSEYFEALAESHKWHRRWIWIRGHFSIVTALIVGLKVGFLKKFVDVWKLLS